VGGQLIKKNSLDQLIAGVHENRILGWEDIHQFYKTEGENYAFDKLVHALDLLGHVHGIYFKKINLNEFKELLIQSVNTADWITKGIFNSRKKDYENPFRRMLYENQAEMDQVLGKLDDNSFIKNRQEIFMEYQKSVDVIVKKWTSD